jgi:hypothetical protein
MSYAYVNGDGLAVLDAATPAGTESVSFGSDAIRQIKAFLKDATAGYAKTAADLATLTATVAALDVEVTALQGLADELDAAVPVTNNRAVFQTYMTANQSVAHDAGEVAVVFNAEVLDPDTCYDPTTYKFTAPTTGVYFFNCSIRIDVTAEAAPTDITHALKLKVSGSLLAESGEHVGTATGGRTFHLTQILQLTAGNEVQVFYEPAVSGGTATFQITKDDRKTNFQGYRVI